jgi:hypothetical protein
MEAKLFTSRFLTQVKSLVSLHHTIYPWVPPQGIFFEALVEQAFKKSGWSEAHVVATTPNSPQHDLLVGNQKLSIKTETGKGTKANEISITKLCTTEREPWDSATLIGHTLRHLAKYDHMLMLRAIWGKAVINYQLIDVPIDLLKRIKDVRVVPVGRRKGRCSQAGDFHDGKTRLFRVHFDGADGKCQIKNLLVSRCQTLLEWDQPLSR